MNTVTGGAQLGLKSFADLIGHTLSNATATSDTVHFTLTDGRRSQLYHAQDCCESVYVESIVGDLSDLVGSPILLAEESTSEEDPNIDPLTQVKNRLLGIEPTARGDSNTWSFYKLATIKGYVDIRFHGTSDGCYSERVDFTEVT